MIQIVKRFMRKQNKGITMVEMIVTFALMGIFMAAVASVISSSVVLHSELSATMYAQSVSETLLDKITGELAAAQKDRAEGSILIGPANRVGQSEGSGISFTTRDGESAYFINQDGLLTMHYRASSRVTDGGELVNKAERDWSFEPKMYMGYRITYLDFEQLQESNVIEVTIELKHLKTGFTYRTTKCVQCYNFSREADRSMKEGEILRYL